MSTENALLTYRALDQAGHIVLLLQDTNDTSRIPLISGANDAFFRTTQYGHSDIVGRPASGLFPQVADGGGFQDAIRAGRALSADLACKRKDGTEITFGLHLMPAPESAAGRRCFVVVGKDVTGLDRTRKMEDAVQVLLAGIFMSIDDAVAIVDDGGRIVMTNPAFNRLLGYSARELTGRAALDLLAPESRGAVEASIRRQREDQQDLINFGMAVRADGTLLRLRGSSTLVTAGGRQFRILKLRPDAGVAAAGGRDQTAGRINLVGLHEVRAALGDRWPAVAARAMATAEAVLKRRCGPQDSYSRCDDTSFVVCFGALNEKEAAFRAAMIGREIRDRLIGQGETPDTAFVRSIAATVRVPDQPGLSDRTLHASLMDGLDGQLARVEEEARQTLRAAWSSTACVLMPVAGTDANKVVANQIRLPGAVERRLLAALSALPAKECDTFDLDAMLLALAAQQVISAMGRGVATPLLVNVRFDVFLTPAATQRFLATCRKIDPRVASHLVLMLSGLPHGLPKSRILDCISRLRPFCCGVGYYLDDLGQAEGLDLSNSYNPIVGLPFAALAARKADKLKAAIASLHARRAKVLIDDVESAPNAAVLRSLGADMIALAAGTE